MIWLILGVAYAAIVYFMYRRSQGSAAVPVQVAAGLPSGPIDHIEYFWRPG